MSIDPLTLRRPLICLALLLLALPAASATQDTWDLGIRTGIYTDSEDPFLGLEALTQFGDSRFMFNPNVELVFVDRGDLIALSGDVHYDFDVDLEDLDVWAGAGPTILFRDPDRGDSDEEFGVNLLAGIGRNEGALRPYGQLKVILADDSEVVLQVGLRFF